MSIIHLSFTVISQKNRSCNCNNGEFILMMIVIMVNAVDNNDVDREDYNVEDCGIDDSNNMSSLH